jgi:hypothetical protein
MLPGVESAFPEPPGATGKMYSSGGQFVVAGHPSNGTGGADASLPGAVNQHQMPGVASAASPSAFAALQVASRAASSAFALSASARSRLLAAFCSATTASVRNAQHPVTFRQQGGQTRNHPLQAATSPCPRRVRSRRQDHGRDAWPTARGIRPQRPPSVDNRALPAGSSGRSGRDPGVAAWLRQRGRFRSGRSAESRQAPRPALSWFR